MYSKIKMMIKYISTSSKKHHILVNTWISTNFQSRSVIRNSNRNKLIRSNQVQCFQKQEKIINKTNFDAINKLVTHHNWMNWMHFSEIIWKYSNQNHVVWIEHKRFQSRISWFLILLSKTGNSAAVYSFQCT